MLTPEIAAGLVSNAIQITALIVCVLVVPSLLGGLVVSVFQAATQINEQMLSFLPRLLITLGMLLFGGHWILRKLSDLFIETFKIAGSLAFKKGHENRPLSDEEATIHISNVRSSYVKDLRHLFSLRDILKAKIKDDRQMRLSTGDEDLGVIKAYCNRCLTGLARKDSKLVCPNCGSTETRKMSSAYGLGVV